MGLVVAAACLGCAAAPTAPTPPAAPVPPINAGGSTIVVGQQPCCPKQTLPEFLGITGLFKAAGAGLTRLRSALGMCWPGLEPRPPVLPITDPANLESPNPAVSAAAEIKAQEDAAAQKIKGLRYLATIGCGGCYPDVEQALLAGLDDCTEAVRYEAAAALRSTAGNPCQFCNDARCCSPAVRKKLNDIAYGTNERTHCYKESSARVRRMARLALAGCGGGPVEEPTLPREGPGAGDVPANAAPSAAFDSSLAPTAEIGWRQTPPSPPPSNPCPTCARTSYMPTPLPPTDSPPPAVPCFDDPGQPWPAAGPWR